MSREKNSSLRIVQLNTDQTALQSNLESQVSTNRKIATAMYQNNDAGSTQQELKKNPNPNVVLTLPKVQKVDKAQILNNSITTSLGRSSMRGGGLQELAANQNAVGTFNVGSTEFLNTEHTKNDMDKMRNSMNDEKQLHIPSLNES